ncbi:MAG: hypothetical protein ACJAT2_002076 [Bacteriovoracaceae bacterium]|jgi:hypothetical protein
MKRAIRLAAIAGMLWAVMAGNLMGAEVLLAKVTNDHDALNGRLFLILDEEGKATGMRLFDLADNTSKNFLVRELGQDGIVLKEESGGKYKVIVLRSNDFEVDRGGHFTLDMLYNGATGKRISSELKVDFNGTDWKLYSRGRAITKMNFIVKKVAFLGVVGIKEVEFK